VSGNERIELLKEYFNRNHLYRNGELNFEKKIISYLEIYEDPNTVYAGSLQEIEDSFTDDVIMTGLYPEINQIDFLIPEINRGYDDCSMDTEFINKLEHNRYEYVFLSAHGSPSFHRCDVKSETIKNAEKKAMFYEMRSCSVGDFSKEDYLAGWYLFSGNGLVVDAASTVILGMSVIDTINAKILSKGYSFGEAKKITGSSLHGLLGDPTLKLDREVEEARIETDLESIDFSEISVCDYSSGLSSACQKKEITLTISNSGTQDLVIWALAPTRYKYKSYDFGSYWGSLRFEDQQYNSEKNTFEVTVKPGEETKIYATFYPPETGNYEGSYYIISNAENSSVLEIQFTAHA